MLEVSLAEILLGDGHLAASLICPDGRILYENRAAREILGREAVGSQNITDSLTAPDAWDELMAKLASGGMLEDEPVLLQTLHGNAELCYITVTPQFTQDGTLDRLLCVWATRRKAAAPALSTTDTGTLSEYTRDLEQVLEHRTYQNLLAAEQNEFARDALDCLPVGILVAGNDGQILYRNAAMSDEFGLHPADYLQPDVAHALSADLNRAFRRVVETGMRQFVFSIDPGGLPAAVDVLPLIKINTTQKVLLQFSRLDREEARP